MKSGCGGYLHKVRLLQFSLTFLAGIGRSCSAETGAGLNYAENSISVVQTARNKAKRHWSQVFTEPFGTTDMRLACVPSESYMSRVRQNLTWSNNNCPGSNIGAVLSSLLDLFFFFSTRSSSALGIVLSFCRCCSPVVNHNTDYAVSFAEKLGPLVHFFILLLCQVSCVPGVCHCRR
ncbi:hypothetical protein CLUG_04589 [Clavispora lusitaniae ATCC 42720]|uniref:Secreted protein n=1 Tax=Clavispora lusitaniae (strain ATCC 42720) TaxID=306902 RepID=C4Y8R1_CLAL4|nr:uncharacterized protein CLUG_04589 [Clavispora lusitaniae ATCC 42720]EEQ40461.1 hypothetical protein CLUG_04589 [Clavispora lusitaniae ATCC 42720]